MTAKADETKTKLALAAPSNDQLPAYLQGQSYKSEDNFDNTDVVLPRIKLLQGLSNEVELYPGVARQGEFWHSGLDISLGSSITFVIADRRKKYLLQAPIADGQGILARADDSMTWNTLGKWQIKIKGQKNPVTWEITDLNVEKSGLAGWGTSIPDDEDSPPAATLFYDYLVFLSDHLEYGPAIMSLARSQIKKAKKGLNDKIKLHGDNKRPMQSLLFKAISVDDSSDGQDFKNWQFSSAGFVQDEALFNMAREHVGALANIVIQDEGVPESEGGGVKDSGEGKF